MKNPHYEHFEERWGFQFGKANVTRMAHVEGKYHVIAVDTPDHHVQIGISPTGRAVRIWKDNEEL